LKALLLVLYESMSGLRPKKTETDGLSKLSWEPLNPVPLVTMFRYGVEALTDSIFYHSITHHDEVMKLHEYYGERSSMPDGMSILAHAAEVLHQV
jgi:hypothetical protein